MDPYIREIKIIFHQRKLLVSYILFLISHWIIRLISNSVVEFLVAVVLSVLMVSVGGIGY